MEARFPKKSKRKFAIKGKITRNSDKLTNKVVPYKTRRYPRFVFMPAPDKTPFFFKYTAAETVAITKEKATSEWKKNRLETKEAKKPEKAVAPKTPKRMKITQPEWGIKPQSKPLANPPLLFSQQFTVFWPSIIFALNGYFLTA
jgi:hypothetical protein